MPAFARDGAPPLLPYRGAAVAFVTAVGGGLALTLLRARPWLAPWEQVTLAGLAIGMTALALAWRSRAPRAVAAYWAFQATAAAAITIASRGHGALALLPVLGQTALLVPRRWLAAYAFGAAALVTGATRLRTGAWPEAIGTAAGHLAGIVFVVAFMEMLVREGAARAESERLVADLAARRERMRNARDVHDILGHSLTAIHAQISGAEALRVRDPERSAQLLHNARALTEEGLSEVRRTVALMRDEPRAPLVDELRALVTTARASGVHAELALLGGPPADLPADTSVGLLRAAQECLTNTVRHARASRVVVTLAVRDGGVDMRVEDDGVGATALESGAGLRGVRERIALVGGEVTIRSGPGEGTRVEVRVPLHAIRRAEPAPTGRRTLGPDR